jgi:hypothetical protein
MTAAELTRWAEDLPRRSRPDRPGQRPVRKFVIGTGLVAYSWVAGATAPFSMDALLSVLLPGAVLAAIAYRFAPERIEPPGHINAVGFSYWAIGIAALFEWEAAAFRDNSPPWHPSLTELVDPLIGPHPLKSAAVLVWLLAGWGLVRR